MKVIDLLNKIANGEEVPKKLLYDNEKFAYDDECRDYISNFQRNWLFDDYSISAIINDEVEVIEEDKKIEKIDRTKPFSKFDVADKVDEIIDYINKEKNNEN